MRTISLATLAGVLCLAACNASPDGGNSADVANDAAAANGAVPQAAVNSANTIEASASADRPALTRDYLVGNWDEGDCAQPDVRLNADGSTDGGQWALRGSQIVRTTPQGEDPPLDVEVVDADHFQVSFAGLPPQTMKRCG